MSDSLRAGDSRATDVASGADHDTKIEQLLVAGLDHYFAARYEQAINVWTRALFFDRGHARARAYIDRARSALAERQRESEELLQRGVAAFHRGERDEAGRLLRAAIDGGALADEAHAILDRLHRPQGPALSSALESDSPRAASPTKAPFSGRLKAPSPSRGVKAPRRVGLAVAAALVVAGVVGAYWAVIRAGLDLRAVFVQRETATGSTAAPAARDRGLPLPIRGELALGRARSLAAGGRLHEALAVLQVVRPTDPQKPEADRVRAEIQQQLLALTASPATGLAARDM